MKHLKKTVIALGTVLAMAPSLALAVTPPFQQANNNLVLTGTAAGVNTQNNLYQIIGGLINVFLGFLSILFLVLMLYAGFLWMTAQGDEKKVEKAQGMIRQAIIGLVIIVAAWTLTTFVFGSIINATGTT